MTGIAESLRRHIWASNVHELQSVIERIAAELTYTKDANAATQGMLRLTTPEVSAHATPDKPTALTLHKCGRGAGVEEIRIALAARGGGWDAVRAALGINKATLWQWLQEITSIR